MRKEEDARTVLAREQWLALEHFRKNAAGTPDVDRDVVFLPGQHDFRSTVVSRRDVASHLRVLDSCEAEITDLQVVSEWYVRKVEYPPSSRNSRL